MDTASVVTASGAPAAAAAAPAPAAPPSGRLSRLRPDATALAISLAVVAVHASVFPSMPVAPWAAVLNEWLVWFTGLYVLLTGLTAVSQRVAPPGGLFGRARAAGRAGRG